MVDELDEDNISATAENKTNYGRLSLAVAHSDLTRSLMVDNLCWKTTFDGRQLSLPSSSSMSSLSSSYIFCLVCLVRQVYQVCLVCQVRQFSLVCLVQGGRIFEISWEPNFPVNNFARDNGKIAPSSTQ